MKRALGLMLSLLVGLSAAWVATPMFLIYPFRAQSPSRLVAGRALIVEGRWLSPLLLVLGALAAALLWRRLNSWKGRVLTGATVAALIFCAFMGRRNTFEAMYHPLPHPEFAAAGDAKDVADEDLVLGVQIGVQARAYPVRAMAYHHLVNDVVGGEPIVATY